jgi:hypothetical protein
MRIKPLFTDNRAHNIPAVTLDRSLIILQYSGFSSIRTAFRPSSIATLPVVPVPPKGSRTVSPGLLPASMHSLGSSSGNVAKCASLYGCVAIVHTVLLFRPAGCEHDSLVLPRVNPNRSGSLERIPFLGLGDLSIRQELFRPARWRSTALGKSTALAGDTEGRQSFFRCLRRSSRWRILYFSSSDPCN